MATPATDVSLDLPVELVSLGPVYEELRHSGSANGLKRAYITLSRVLSAKLQDSVLSVYSDDDDSDFACLSESGRVLSVAARCDEIVVRFADGAVSKTAANADDAQVLHAVASEVFQSFFGIPASELGFGTFDPPENFGFMVLQEDA